MKKLISFLTIFIVVIYFVVGWYAYGQAATVPCEVWFEEANNTPASFTLGDKASWDPSEFFIEGYEDVTIFADDGEVELKSWWVENNLLNPTILSIFVFSNGKTASVIISRLGGESNV